MKSLIVGHYCRTSIYDEKANVKEVCKVDFDFHDLFLKYWCSFWRFFNTLGVIYFRTRTSKTAPATDPLPPPLLEKLRHKRILKCFWKTLKHSSCIYLVDQQTTEALPGAQWEISTMQTGEFHYSCRHFSKVLKLLHNNQVLVAV